MTCVPHQDVHVRDCIRPELLMTGREGDVVDMGLQVRAFHPHRGDVVFLQRPHVRIFVGNLKSGHLDTVGYGFQSLQIISLDLPCWPTPVPSITTTDTDSQR